MKRRTMIGLGLATPFTTAWAAGSYASRPVTFVVGYAAGGNVDNFARALGTGVGEILKQPVVIENKPGANEMIAAQLVSRAEPDGHSILISTEAPITQSQFLYRKVPYVPEDLTPIALLVQVPLVLVVRPNLPVNTLKEFVEYARKNGMIAGSAGIGGVTHLPMAMLARTQNISWTHAPYKGSSAMFPDLVSGRIDACFTGSSAAIAQIKAGNVKGLAVGSKQRLSALPQVETFEENGLLNIGSSYTIGAYGPKNLSEEAKKQLIAAFHAVANTPRFMESAVTPSGYVLDGLAGAPFSDHLKRDRLVQKERVAASGAQLD